MASANITSQANVSPKGSNVRPGATRCSWCTARGLLPMLPLLLLLLLLLPPLSPAHAIRALNALGMRAAIAIVDVASARGGRALAPPPKLRRLSARRGSTRAVEGGWAAVAAAALGPVGAAEALLHFAQREEVAARVLRMMMAGVGGRLKGLGVA